MSVPSNEVNSLFGTLDEAKKGKNILHKLQYRKGVKVNYHKRRPGDIAQVYADTKKFKKILKWKPKYNNIKKIILSAIRWEKELQNN